MSSIAANIRCGIEYARAAVSLVLVDRGLLLTDLILATAAPFMAQAIVWRFIYDSSHETIHGLSYSGTLFYYALAIVMGRLNNGYGIIEDLSEGLQDGRLEVLLIRPFSYPMQKLSDFLGGSLVYTLPVAVVLMVQIFFSKESLPWTNLSYFIGALTLVAFSQLLCFSISFALALIAFKTVRSDLVLALQSVIAAFLGGILLPPQFWPSALRPLMEFNPYRFMIAAPAEVLVQKNWHLLFQSIGFCIFYTLLLAGIACFFWKKATRNYSSVGG